MKKVLITHGHTHNKSDQGANAHNEKTEGLLNYNLAMAVEEYLRSTYIVEVDVVQECINKALSWNVKSRRGYDFAMSIHHNAFNGQATGTEVLYKDINKKVLAKEFSKLIADNLGIVNRGAKRRTKLYILNIGFDVYLEVCFIDNKKDYGSNYKLVQLAKVIGDKIASKIELKKIEKSTLVTSEVFEYEGKDITVNRILYNDENFIKVKDLGKFGLGVEWDSERRKVVVTR